ncbi:hypothetical protein [Paraflavitalea sp. CAU 1676]|uniref:hypothetical protein n=1 Tax=Paraflavitalea sp. CAU 1676 TaxID=3032598 RepID=UPI0023DB2049|nr:hypothetical protein [Paraflavitalea sp. CAU 1676]MDF2191176.1 hypothetical protein [Paraflavitalea sp. CAU 1676]
MKECANITTLKPAFRKLRAFTFDPSLSLKLDTSVINNLVYKVPWESLRPGPVGEYIEVVDFDPSSNCFYKPVNLDDPYTLAQDGLDPAESNPQFHQQMAYAVAMVTIKNFERALGRKILWSPCRDKEGYPDGYVQRLRIYPHALREANAYYSPQKKALLFGYFSAAPDTPSLLMPGGTVYTCLSHDIIAHEITHALLDGMHRRYIEATHPDSLAFHEAFADIVALFQHFTFPEVLKDQIARTRGDLASQNLLGQLAQEFGKAIGHYGSLRDALGEVNDETGKWEPLTPNPVAYQKIIEPHERGSILVATIFDVFSNIYRRRVADLLRIATGGTGMLSAGSLHPDLVNRMATEASKSAGQILKICIRALDYCPPMDINFGDYLRAMITADYDLVEDDNLDYRIAIIEAFQRRGIFPDNVKNMSVESLLCKVEDDADRFEHQFKDLIEFFKLFKEKISYVTKRKDLYNLTRVFITGGDINSACEDDDEAEYGAGRAGSSAAASEAGAGLGASGAASGDMYAAAVAGGGIHSPGAASDAGASKRVAPAGVKDKKGGKKENRIMGLHQRLNVKFMGVEEGQQFSKLTGLLLDDEQIDVQGIGRSTAANTFMAPKLEVHNLKLASRVGPSGNVVNQILVTLTQRRGVVCETDQYGNVEVKGFFVPESPEKGYYTRPRNEDEQPELKPYPEKTEGLTSEGSEKVLPKGWFVFRGGCTMIFDLDYALSKDNVKLKYIIKKDINDLERMKRQYRMLFNNKDFSLNATYFGTAYGNLEAEPFAIIHKIL